MVVGDLFVSHVIAFMLAERNNPPPQTPALRPHT
jgi:hypothetical protein